MKRHFTLLCLLVASAFAMNAQELQFFITSPANIEGQVIVGAPTDGFGGELIIGESLAGTLQLVQTTDPDPAIWTNGCDSIINVAEVAGKIALIDRGACSFTQKVLSAEAAGAIGAVICNNQPGAGVIGMLGSPNGATSIPSAFLSYETCQTIKAEIDNGIAVDVLLQVPAMRRPITNFAHSIPVEQTLPLATLGITVTNANTEAIDNAEIYMDLTTPSGETFSETALIEVFEAGADSLVTFELDYTPEEIGTYNIVYSTGYNTDVQEATFEINDTKIFRTDSNEGFGAAANQDSWSTGYVYWYASLYQMNEMDADANWYATHMSFGIGNGDSLAINNDATFNNVIAYLYNADADADGSLDFSAASTVSYEEGLSTVVGFGQYVIQGGETATDAPILVELTDVQSGELNVPLLNNGVYYAAVEYKGDASLAPTTIAFTTSSGVDYGYPSTTLLALGNNLFTGWNGATVLSRLHIDNTINTDDNMSQLEGDKANAYPNPSAGLINLDLDFENTAEEVRIDVINYDGKVVETLYLNDVKTQSLQLDVTDQPNGYYFVSIKSPEGYRSIPVFVAK